MEFVCRWFIQAANPWLKVVVHSKRSFPFFFSCILYENFHPLGYFYNVLQCRLLSAHPIFSMKHIPVFANKNVGKAFCTSLADKTKYSLSKLYCVTPYNYPSG